MKRDYGHPVEWVWPLAFVIVAAFVVWSMPSYIIGFGGASDAMKTAYTGAGPLEWLALVAVPVVFVLGARSVNVAPMEWQDWSGFDRISLFLGRVTMMLVALIVGVMSYEVFVRYVLEKPTLWANELSLWLAGFVFLLAGLYAMQQRSHIRIYILYDLFPRWLQKLCDTISTLLIVLFAVAMVWGAFNEAWDKFFRWERFGTAFDPPIPATLKPMVILIICLVALQAVVNLINDWNRAPEHHTDEPDQAEIDELRATLED